MSVLDEKFEFTVLPRTVLEDIKAASLESTELFEKWGLDRRMRFATFLYNKHFQIYQKDTFTKDFFQSPVVNAVLEMPSSSGHSAPLCMATIVTGANVEEVNCSIVSMDFFNLLQRNGIVKPNGSIVKCFDEMCEDFLVSDELRKALIMEESDGYSAFSDEDRQQFLFRVFKHVSLGGPVNQYEDYVEPYLKTAKLLYKQLLTVVKNSSTSQLSISSLVLKVEAKVDDRVVFPWQQSDHPQSFCYLVLDNYKRHVTAWYHTWY